jgi:hypothetical protein
MSETGPPIHDYGTKTPSDPQPLAEALYALQIATSSTENEVTHTRTTLTIFPSEIHQQILEYSLKDQ